MTHLSKMGTSCRSSRAGMHRLYLSSRHSAILHVIMLTLVSQLPLLQDTPGLLGGQAAQGQSPGLEHHTGVPTLCSMQSSYHSNPHRCFLMKQIMAAASAPKHSALQTYVPWNLHEPSPGVYKWDGTADLTGYLDLAARLGLNVLLRAGPYICGEWDFGGLPWWLAYPAVHAFLLAPARSSSSAGLKVSCLLMCEPALRLHGLPGICEQQHKCSSAGTVSSGLVMPCLLRLDCGCCRCMEAGSCS